MREVIKIISGGGIVFFKVDDCELDEKFITANIGSSDGTSWFERTSFFNMTGIDIICDEEGKLKGLKPSLQIMDDYIAGDCLIVSLEENYYGEPGWYGLNDEKFKEVLQRLIF